MTTAGTASVTIQPMAKSATRPSGTRGRRGACALSVRRSCRASRSCIEQNRTSRPSRRRNFPLRSAASIEQENRALSPSTSMTASGPAGRQKGQRGGPRR
jgi:hypothetical protein